MTERPPAIVVSGARSAPSLPPGWTPIPLARLPAEPFGLGDQRLGVIVSVGDAEAAAAVLLAAARGVAVAATLEVSGSLLEALLDDLGRVAELQFGHGEAPALDAVHVELLDELAGGATLTEAARRLGWSRRTATRRLAEARVALGASTTAEAVAAHRRAAG